ncbi:hypothetical protein [Joostella sp. CR20]|uniref:hypothetical protein n=1 Tax=Joostella sp. CR20 TaxID=2804312 RepID=UPI00313D3274
MFFKKKKHKKILCGNIEDNYNLTLHKSVDTIIAKNFFQAQETGVFDSLVVGYNEAKEVSYLPIDTPFIWNELFNDWCKATENNESIILYQLIIEINYLESRKEIAYKILELIGQGVNKDMFKELCKRLSALGFTINQNKPLQKEINRLSRQLNSAQNRIDLKKNEAEKLIKKDNGEKTSVLEMKVKIERMTGKNHIDLSKITLREWLYIINDAVSVSEMKNKNVA